MGSKPLEIPSYGTSIVQGPGEASDEPSALPSLVIAIPTAMDTALVP
jgi:hypothetical protein